MVDVRSTYNDFSSGDGCGLTGGTAPADFQYPDYLGFPTVGEARAYSWDATGFVTFELEYLTNTDPRLLAIEALTKQLEMELRLIREALLFPLRGMSL